MGLTFWLFEHDYSFTEGFIQINNYNKKFELDCIDKNLAKNKQQTNNSYIKIDFFFFGQLNWEFLHSIWKKKKIFYFVNWEWVQIYAPEPYCPLFNP